MLHNDYKEHATLGEGKCIDLFHSAANKTVKLNKTLHISV